jgi:hypothetical protein
LETLACTSDDAVGFCAPLQVELIMVERDAAGHSAGQFSVGWAQMPLFTDAARNSPIPSSQAAAAAAAAAATPLMSGSPRYLLFRYAIGKF